ncbi:MAG: hypothetical protein NTV34_05580 [Proteobacteria bacterium]|nr:hypothetical protein [Pseudomonadota bacterium]
MKQQKKAAAQWEGRPFCSLNLTPCFPSEEIATCALQSIDGLRRAVLESSEAVGGEKPNASDSP